jgi:TRAP-type C4-dicarboxylate transport system substrate-binding protein
MSVLELSDEQVISIVRQLPAARRRTALLALAQEAQARREERMRFGEAQLRQACAERGLDWDRMSEEERETFVDDLLHEK